ncbi:MAG: methyltransferase domain-containing protein [Actinomycetia bacterium]|nr:methyltransferase domain-containing protein [Actinomycetes bacterium]
MKIQRIILDLDYVLEDVDYPALYDPHRMKALTRHIMATSLVKKMFPEPSGVTVGDFGCGRGMTSIALAELGYSVFAIDADEDRVESIRRKTVEGYIRCIVSNIEDLDMPLNSLDAALAIELIEHCAYPENMLEQMLGYVRPGGVLILTTPNGAILGSRLILKLPTYRQVLGMEDRSTLVRKQYTADVHLLRFKLEEIECTLPPETEVMEMGYFGLSAILLNKYTYHLYRLLPLDLVYDFIWAFPRIPIINRKVASKVYAVVRKI